jgi:hypothetical protein
VCDKKALYVGEEDLDDVEVLHTSCLGALLIDVQAEMCSGPSQMKDQLKLIIEALDETILEEDS